MCTCHDLCGQFLFPGFRYVDDPDISEGLGNQWVASQLVADLEPLFAKYQVDMTWVRRGEKEGKSGSVKNGQGVENIVECLSCQL